MASSFWLNRGEGLSTAPPTSPSMETSIPPAMAITASIPGRLAPAIFLQRSGKLFGTPHFSAICWLGRPREMQRLCSRFPNTLEGLASVIETTLKSSKHTIVCFRLTFFFYVSDQFVKEGRPRALFAGSRGIRRRGRHTKRMLRRKRRPYPCRAGGA